MSTNGQTSHTESVTFTNSLIKKKRREKIKIKLNYKYLDARPCWRCHSFSTQLTAATRGGSDAAQFPLTPAVKCWYFTRLEEEKQSVTAASSSSICCWRCSERPVNDCSSLKQLSQHILSGWDCTQRRGTVECYCYHDKSQLRSVRRH